ncbi:MAG: DUF5330 domain-containing protein [Hyphomicrobiales bacterium]
MYIIRTAFWLAVIVFLLPIGDEGSDRAQPADTEHSSLSASDALGAAVSTVEDVASLCARKPHICEAGSAAWQTFERKARYSVRTIYRWAHGDEKAAEEDLAPQAPARNSEDSSAGLIDLTTEFQVSDNAEPLHTGSTETNAPSGASNAGQPDSQNTLTIEDLIPEWSGPGRKARA